MQKSGGVVTLMQLNSNEIKYLIGSAEVIQEMIGLPALNPFDDSVIDFLDRLSKLILNNDQAKQYSDVITFGFWCRKASIKNMQKHYAGNLVNKIGRGIAFHIAPSNVAVNYAYSLVVGLLSGNANVVRLSSKEFDQVKIINELLNAALDDHISKYITLLQYNHSKAITDSISALCDTRIIWGGDNTIFEIRKSPIKARATEITFADRYSICLINSDVYLGEKNKKSVALSFFNDTFLTDQNACTSPRLVAWMGQSIEEAQEIFWGELDSIVKEKYLLQPVQAVSKYTKLCKYGALVDGVHLVSGKDNYIVRINVDKINKDLTDFFGNSGYFIECKIQMLSELLPICSSECQTISYYGIDVHEIQKFIMTNKPRGIDRIVPLGKTMDFNLVWDGYDLIRSLTREVVVW